MRKLAKKETHSHGNWFVVQSFTIYCTLLFLHIVANELEVLQIHRKWLTSALQNKLDIKTTFFPSVTVFLIKHACSWFVETLKVIFFSYHHANRSSSVVQMIKLYINRTLFTSNSQTLSRAGLSAVPIGALLRSQRLNTVNMKLFMFPDGLFIYDTHSKNWLKKICSIYLCLFFFAFVLLVLLGFQHLNE